jgi:hypothetical protein
VAYVRTVKTASGARAVQIVHSSRRGSKSIEHVGPAHDDEELEALKAAAKQRLSAGQGELDLGLDVVAASGGPLEIVSSRMGHPWEALCRAYDALGFDKAAGGDEVFRDLVLARIIEPTSKQDSLRVLTETGVDPASYRTVTRRLPLRPRLVAAEAGCGVRGPCGAGSGVPGALRRVDSVLRDRRRGGFREPGSPRNAVWTPKSLWGCSPTRRGSR